MEQCIPLPTDSGSGSTSMTSIGDSVPEGSTFERELDNNDDSGSSNLTSIDTYSPSESPAPNSIPRQSLRQNTNREAAMQDVTSSSQDIRIGPQVIIHASCMAENAPTLDKKRSNIESIQRDFPDDLPYVITYENKALQVYCQECDRILHITKITIAKHSSSILHGIRVKRRLDSQGLKETSTSQVEARHSIISRQSAASLLGLENQEKYLKRRQPVEPCEENSDINAEPQRLKRQRLAHPCTDKHSADNTHPDNNIQLDNKSHKKDLRKSPESYKDKGQHGAMEKCVSLPEIIPAMISRKLSDIDRRFEEGMKSQRNRSLHIATELNGVDHKSNQRLECLERKFKKMENMIENSNTQFNSFTKLYNSDVARLEKTIEEHKRVIEDLRVQAEAPLHSYKVDLGKLERELQGEQELAVGLAKRFADLENKQKNEATDLGTRLGETESKLKGQHECIQTLASRIAKMEHRRDEQVKATEGLATRLGNLVRGENDDTSSSTVQSKDSTKTGNSGTVLANIIRGNNTMRVQLENKLQQYQRSVETLQESITISQKATINGLSDFTDRLAKQEKKISVCKATGDRISNLEECTRGFRMWLEEINSESAEQQLQQDKLYSELQQKVLEIQNSSIRTVALEGRIQEHDQCVINFNDKQSQLQQQFSEAFDKIIMLPKPITDRMVHLENGTAEFRKKLEDMVTESQRSKEHAEITKENMSKSLENSQVIINQVAELGKEVKRFQKKQEDMDSLIGNHRKEHIEIFEKERQINWSNLNATTIRLSEIAKDVRELQEKVENIIAAEEHQFNERKELAEPTKKDYLDIRHQISKISTLVDEFPRQLSDIASQLEKTDAQAGLYNIIVDGYSAQLSDIASQMTQFTVPTERTDSGSSDFLIDNLLQSKNNMMKRLATVEENVKQPDTTMLKRLENLEANDEKQVAKIVELDRKFGSLDNPLHRM